MPLKPEIILGSTLLMIGLLIAMHGCVLLSGWLRERRYFRHAAKGMEKKLILSSDERVKRAIYNPRPMRRQRLMVANEEYDPYKHFRCEGQTDRKW